MATLKSFDDYTFNHSVNVSLISMLIGKRLGLSQPYIEVLGTASMLHDLGKLVVPREILNKPGRLTESEWRVMYAHPEQGAQKLLERVDAHDIAITVAYEHHSGYVGDGYPTLVPGKRQHIYSRIVAIADVFDALTSPRAYRTQLSPAEALKYVIDGQGTNFDPDLVKVFFRTTGVYPVGTAVYFNTGETGVVHDTNESAPVRPVVKLVFNSSGIEIVPEFVDLATISEKEVWIEKTLPPTIIPAHAMVA